MSVQFCDVRASYGVGLSVLNGVSFSIDDGEFVAVIGANGAGKSTAMRLINGLLKPDSGRVLVDGVATTQLKTSELARRVGFLFQNPDNQICCSTVREELLFGFSALKKDAERAQSRIEAIAEDFGLDLDAEPFLLNRGSRQLLALASIVVLEPATIVLDEPTTGLDFRECEMVLSRVRRLNKQGTTVIMVCHDMELVADHAERVIAMSEGRVIDDGPAFEVLRNPATLAAASLVAPQIADISMRLCADRPELAESPVAHANTVDEMAVAVAAAINGREAADNRAAAGKRAAADNRDANDKRRTADNRATDSRDADDKRDSADHGSAADLGGAANDHDGADGRRVAL